MRFEVTVTCPWCSHEFRASIQAPGRPDAQDLYAVICPSNGSRFWFFPAGSAEQRGFPVAREFRQMEGPTAAHQRLVPAQFVKRVCLRRRV
jgi:hypothetical protein